MLLMIAMLLAISAAGQTSSIIAGTWQGEKQGSPFVILNVRQAANGKLSGTAVFFILDRESGHTPPKVLGKEEVQLLNPKLDGRVFTFSVRNQQGQVVMNASSGETLEFQLTMDNETRASLKSNSPDAETIKMLKQ